MTALVLSVLAPVWHWLAAALAGLAGLGALYWKGRRDARLAARLEDLDNAERIRKAGADARARADSDAASGGLRDDDGFRRP